MREFKFRGWDGKKMYYHDDGMQHGNLTLCFNDISGWNFYYEGLNAQYVCGASHHENDVLMQFTGLKDKNGKDVYEGDIANVNTSFVGKVHVCIWNEPHCQFMWQLKDIGVTSADFRNLYDDLRTINRFDKGDDIEIIGNIYETPQLLNNYEQK